MARPKKNIVEYFSHSCNHERPLSILIDKYGNDGYAFYFRLQELLGKTDGHTIQVDEDMEWEYLLTQVGCLSDNALEMITLLVKIGEIDKDLWENEKRIWWQSFTNLLTDVYDKRKNDIPNKNSFRYGNPSLRGGNPVNVTETLVYGAETTQSKVNKSKAKYTKKEDSWVSKTTASIDISHFKNIYKLIDVEYSFKKYMFNMKEKNKKPTSQGFELWLENDMRLGYNTLHQKDKKYTYVCPVENCESSKQDNSKDFWTFCDKHEPRERMILSSQ
tara:strand:+ start:56 stop:877 length:822 start_codon:yes stop_codon:yes gene_type:complete